MAARRLLIVMLVLLGLSTLAAALVPQHSLRDSTTGSTTTTQPAETTTTPKAAAGRSLRVKIAVGGDKVPVVANPICRKPKAACEPLHVGDQLSLQVFSKTQAQLEIPVFGLIGVASSNTPALFEILPQQAGRIGVLFTSPRKVAATIVVLSAKDAAKTIQRKRAKAKSRAPAGSGPA
jgi:hypothetical protein